MSNVVPISGELHPQFSDDELKLLLVAVRQMRRTFAAARRNSRPAAAASLETYAALYDDLFEKLRGIRGTDPGKCRERTGVAVRGEGIFSLMDLNPSSMLQFLK